MNEQITLLDLLKLTENDLKAINVPIEYADQIARPLCGVLTNIRTAIDALQRDEHEKEEENVQS